MRTDPALDTLASWNKTKQSEGVEETRCFWVLLVRSSFWVGFGRSRSLVRFRSSGGVFRSWAAVGGVGSCASLAGVRGALVPLRSSNQKAQTDARPTFTRKVGAIVPYLGSFWPRCDHLH